MMTEDELHQALRTHDDPPTAETLALARQALLRAARSDLNARVRDQTRRRRITSALALAVAACGLGFVLGRSSAPSSLDDGRASGGTPRAPSNEATALDRPVSHQHNAAPTAPGSIPELMEVAGIEGAPPGLKDLGAEEVKWIPSQAKSIERGGATRIKRAADLHESATPPPNPEPTPPAAPTDPVPELQVQAMNPNGSTGPGEAPRIPVHAPSPSPTEQAFQSGWAALEAGDFLHAARHFRVASESQDPLAEDASYWHAEALHRGGRQAAAELALAEHLRRFPSSPRAARAHLRLGAWLLSSGRREAAGPHLDAAIRADPNLGPEVRSLRDADAQP